MNVEENWASSVMGILDKIIKLIYINLLWFVFTIAGLGIFGIMPSTAAVFSITRKMIKGEEISNVFSDFWKVFKQSFVICNLVGVLFFTIGVFLYIDMRIVKISPVPTGKIFLILLSIIFILFFSVLLNFFPIYTRLEMKVIHYLKLSLVLGLGSPLTTLAMTIWVLVVYILCIHFTVLIPLLSISLLCLGINWLSIKTIEKKLFSTNMFANFERGRTKIK